MPPDAVAGTRIWILTHPFGDSAVWIARSLERCCRERAHVRVLDLFTEWLPSSSVLGRFASEHDADFFPVVVGDFAAALQKVPDSPVLRELADGAAARFAASVAEERPDVIVSVSSLVGAIVTEFSTSGARTVTVYPDFDLRGAWLHPGTGLHVVAVKEAREDLVVHGVAWDRVHVAGTIAPFGPGATTQRPASDRFRVALAADAAVSDARTAIRALERAGTSVSVVASGDERADRRLLDAARGGAPGNARGVASTVAQAVADTDVVIAAAGSRSLAQALSAGKPCLIYYSEPDAEIYNVDFLVNTGAAMVVRDDEDMVCKVRFLSAHPRRLDQMRSQATELSGADAAQRVCERVLAMR